MRAVDRMSKRGVSAWARPPAVLVLAAMWVVGTPVAAPVLSTRPPEAIVAFSPGRAMPLVLETIRQARTSIMMAAYVFTSKPIAMALRDAARRGVTVMAVVDAQESAKAYSAARFLANERIAVRTNARYAIQHNKFMVIDSTTVQTGSFNYTESAADRNAENVVVLRDTPKVASVYAAEWHRLWNESTELPPAY